MNSSYISTITDCISGVSNYDDSDWYPYWSTTTNPSWYNSTTTTVTIPVWTSTTTTSSLSSEWIMPETEEEIKKKQEAEAVKIARIESKKTNPELDKMYEL